MEDCIDAFLDDPRITTIGLFLEAVREPQHFAAVARRAHSQGVPIVALQTGRSATGAAIATSHTGSMSGRAAAYDALFARYGVATVTTPAEMLETLKLLDNGGRLTGPRMVSMSCSGGRGVAGRRPHGAAARCSSSHSPNEHRRPHRIDRDRARHRQQSVRLQHVHVGRSGRDREVLHRGHRRPSGRDDARPRRAAEPRQRCVGVDRRRRCAGRRGRGHRAACRRRRHDGRVPQRGTARPHRRARADPVARSQRRPRRAGSRRGGRQLDAVLRMPPSPRPADVGSSTKRTPRPGSLRSRHRRARRHGRAAARCRIGRSGDRLSDHVEGARPRAQERGRRGEGGLAATTTSCGTRWPRCRRPTPTSSKPR